MDFSQADHGVDIMGMQNYIEDLNTIVLVDVATALRNTGDIRNAVNNGWHGNAPQVFIANIEKAKDRQIETFAELKKTFETELKGVQSEILDMDANLVEEE